MSSMRKFIFEIEAVAGINSPNDYPYIKMLRVMLAPLNAWPFKEIGLPESRALSIFLIIFHLFLWCGACFGMVCYIILHFSSMTLFEMGHIYITALIVAVDSSRIINLTLDPKYRLVAKDFLTKFHLFYYKDKSEYSMETHKLIHRISHWFTIFIIVQMMTGLCLFNLIPMYNNYAAGKYSGGDLTNSTFEHSLYYSHPFNTSTSVRGYIFACILHWLISYLSSTWFCMIDLFLSIMVFNVWGHFKILLHNLNSFPRPSILSKFSLPEYNMTITNEMFSESELIDVKKKLGECIEYHRLIVDFTARMSNVFGPMLFVYYIFHQASGCLLLLECSQMTVAALMRYLPLTIILFQQLMQLSIIFELVGSESEKLKDAVYGLPWECMDTKNRRIVTIFLMNVQEPVHVKALGVADVGVNSMATILKTSLSYFTFLRSM